MAEIKFSQLTTAAQLTNDDIFALAQMQGGSLSSVKTSMIAVANFLNTQVQYTTAYNTQAKTTAGAINELRQLISLIPQFSIEVVEEFPTEDISDTTIYLVPAEDPEVGNYYEEYIHVNDSWELVGTTAVDLSAYYTKLEVDGLLATKASVAEVALKENKSDMPTDVRTIIKDCKTPKSATITNGIAQFECIEENLVKGLKVTMNPIQDLHGYSNPWVGGEGKNKLPLTVANLKSLNTSGTWSGNAYTLNNVVFTALTDDDGNVTGINANGTANAPIAFSCGMGVLTNATYIGNGCPAGGGANTYRVQFYVTGISVSYNDTGNGVQFTNSGVSSSCAIFIANGYNAQNVKFYPMIRLSTVTDATFAPYSNTCPISGRTEVSVTRTGKNEIDEDFLLLANGWTKSGGEYSGLNNALHTAFSGGYSGDIKFRENTQYTVSFDFKANEDKITVFGFKYSDGTTSTSYLTNTTYERKNFTSTINKTVVGILFSYEGSTTVHFKEFQLEQGSTATTYEPYTAETKTHQYSETIYGGVDDFVNGVLKNGWSDKVDLGTLNWDYNSNYSVFTAYIPPAKKNAACACDSYAYSGTSVGASRPDKTINVGLMYFSSSFNVVSVKDTSYTSAADFKAAMNGVELVYELATPTTIETSAEEIATVAGTNIISGTEPIFECKYTELATVDDLIKIIGGQ